MTIEQLRDVHRAQPFRPFTLELADGQKVPVPHPEFLAFSRSGRTVFVANENDAFKIIDLLLVTAIQVGNGAARTRRRN
jgi:hypothetical protein